MPVWMALLVAVYYWLPGLRVEAWGLIGPERERPPSWWASSSTVLPARRPGCCWPLQQASFVRWPGQLPAGGDDRDPPPLSLLRGNVLVPADLSACNAAGLLIFIRWRTSRPGPGASLIDALTLTAGLALLSWIYLVLPYVHNPALSWLQKKRRHRFTPLGDVLVLAMIARLLAPGDSAGQMCPASSRLAPSGDWRRTCRSACSSCTGRFTTGPSSTSAGPSSMARGAPRHCIRR